MKYFFVETDEKNRIPYSINKNRAIDTRKLNRKEFGNLPRWNLLEMETPMEVFFPDLICSPCILMSEECMDAVRIYHPDTLCRGVKLWDKKTGINATYLLTVLEEVDCISEETEYNPLGNRIVRLVLDREKVGDRAVFRIKNYDRAGIVGRLDFVESLLRRNGRGIRLEEIEVRQGKKQTGRTSEKWGTGNEAGR